MNESNLSLNYYSCGNCHDRNKHEGVCVPTLRPPTNRPPKLSRMERRIIADAITAIETRPETVDMQHWMIHDHGEDEVPETEDGYCGTVACLAGHVALAAQYPPLEVIGVNDKVGRRAKTLGYRGSVASIARRILHISPKRQNILFMTSGWPYEFKLRHAEAYSRADRAKVVADRLRHYLATGR